MQNIKSNNNAAAKKYAIVTGASSGIGFQTSLLLARNGFYTYATKQNVFFQLRIISLLLVLKEHKQVLNKENLQDTDEFQPGI